jgi:hypothetical protein
MATRAAEAGEDVSRQHRAYQIAQMFDPGDIWQGGRDQNSLFCGHGLGLRLGW